MSVENQCYVIAAAQTGKHNAKRASYGHACIIDPWGTIIAECPEGENVVMAELSVEKIKEVRSNMPINLHRRPDLYALASVGGFELGRDEENYNFATIGQI